MKKKIVLSILVAAVMAVIVGAIINSFIKNNNITKNNKNVFYTIPKEANIEALSRDFYSIGIIKNKLYFKFIAKRRGLEGNIRNERIMIQPNINIEEVIGKLKSSKPEFAIVTIPEGFRVYQIAERLEKNNLVDKKAFMNLNLKDIKGAPLISQREYVLWDLEGFLFPDTYFIPTSFTEKDIAQLMFNRFKEIFSQRYMDRVKELKLTINDIISIASLIEREAITEEERSRIAGVIYNRLKKGMLLQIDAAVIYANTNGEGHLTKVLYSHLKFDSKYNSYVYKGLPPGPIASPGKPSIEAALYPEQHDFLYYVAGENGHVFSKTYEEHLNNVKKYIKK